MNRYRLYSTNGMFFEILASTLIDAVDIYQGYEAYPLVAVYKVDEKNPFLKALNETSAD